MSGGSRDLRQILRILRISGRSGGSLAPGRRRFAKTLSRLKKQFQSEVLATVRIEAFGPSDTVACIDEGDQLFAALSADVRFVRETVGRHTGPLTISM